MKDPIRIHSRQLEEMKRLIANRIAGAWEDKEFRCKPDTAAKVSGKDVNIARPLQQLNHRHFKTFCECKDWKSKWPEDRKWCEIEDTYERFYAHPFNFDAPGFDIPPDTNEDNLYI